MTKMKKYKKIVEFKLYGSNDKFMLHDYIRVDHNASNREIWDLIDDKLEAEEFDDSWEHIYIKI